MESKYKVTDIPEESSFYDLVAGDNVMEIPLFQRPYSWKNSHYTTMLDDVSVVLEDPTSAIFLGVIVTYSRGASQGRPPTWMVVDGQQRVSTLYLSVLAHVLVAAENGELDWAADIIGRYLLVRPMSGLAHNTKLVPSFNDRRQFSEIWDRVSKVKNLSSHQMYAHNPPRPPSPSGDEEGMMKSQFGNMVKDARREFKGGGIETFSERVDVIATKLSMVSISLREPTVAPKIFERLNYGAEPITVADLVRNEIFARVGNDLDAAQSLFGGKWEPFISRFSDKNTDFNRFLFPYGLIHNSSIRRNDLFMTIRGIWDKLGGPAAIIENLEKFQEPYVCLSSGSNLEKATKSINLRIHRLHSLNRPSSVYPFLMRLLASYTAGQLSESKVLETLDVVESFLVRRAICGIEPTGLHAVFKGLWDEIFATPNDPKDSEINAATIREKVMSRSTISWPSDAMVKDAILNGPLYRRKIRQFAIREYELSLDAECPGDISDIEHIAPQKKPDDWTDVPKDEYEAVLHTWGNLAPISPGMNKKVSAGTFDQKRKEYKNSKFPSVRELSNVEKWTIDEIKRRSEKVSEWAVARWAY
ncbi:hypothetical protein FIV06_07720 [Labrenzia sp. THAF191b]|uniref:DUF262 domain-containing protein n=1 Tax=unclassified Labrenzia TaxID=2648686 RepID=UPI001269199E|nr:MULTISPECIES: DUF262 domain-containing protein [unclassified Labrenzia]QFS97304.1 hypothetical protein FIV06_07720 [Labrenzia sp. THAF191b]QFT03619.1 hypothetical protein FIV05_07720 [Labrenzia sp. THAF191a]QFT15161.1 hypothetical protein FIV03_07725 [Labrenzia sp. THAF187b]